MSNTNTEVLTTAYEKLQGALTQSNTVLPKLEEAVEKGNLDNYATISQLEEKANEINTIIKYIIVNVKFPPPPLSPCVGDGSDETSKIQACIDYINSKTDSCLNTNIGGKLIVPCGVYGVTNVLLKSNIDIVGDGVFSTRFKPLSDTGFVFYTKGTSTSSRIANVNLEGFTIAPSTTFVTQEENRPTCGGIDCSYSLNFNLDKVSIINLDGTAIKSQEQFDSFINRTTIHWCGNEDNYAFLLSAGTGDVTNALHVNQLRMEQCLYGLKINGYEQKQVREIQFISCKFEEVGIDINGAGCLSFGNSHFTIREGKGITIQSGEDTDSRCITFTGCTATSGNGTGVFVNNVSGVDVTLSGCTFTNIATIAAGKNFTIGDCTAYALTGQPFVLEKSKLSNVKTQVLDTANTVELEQCLVSNITCQSLLLKNGNLIFLGKIDDCNITGNNNTSLITDITTLTDNGLQNEMAIHRRERSVATTDIVKKGHIFINGSDLLIRMESGTLKKITLQDYS